MVRLPEQGKDIRDCHHVLELLIDGPLVAQPNPFAIFPWVAPNPTIASNLILPSFSRGTCWSQRPNPNATLAAIGE